MKKQHLLFLFFYSFIITINAQSVDPLLTKDYKAQKTWVIAGFQLKSNVDGEENVVLHMGDIQLVDGLVSRIIVYENQRPKKE